MINFDWNEEKNQSNIRKHGIDFNDATEVFFHPMLNKADTRERYGEERWVGIGLMQSIIIVIVYVENETNTIRIISARKATRREAKFYEKAI